MSGLKVTRCCVHVATLIYYLTYAMHEDVIKFPAKHLNLLFVDFEEKEQSNQPRYVRGKRGRKESTSGSDETDETDESDSENDHELINESNKGNQEKFVEPDLNFLPFKDKENHTLDKSEKYLTTTISPDDTIDHFTAHIPFLGASINFNGESNVEVSHTYLIDNFLFALWSLSKIVENFVSNMPNLEQTKTIKEIIKNIDNYNWNKQKSYGL